MRMMVLWCPDWPVIAAETAEGVESSSPVAVLHANRVVACSAAARAEGVRRGLRKRDAQARCPHLIVVDADPARDTKAFEPVVSALEQVVAGVAVLRPGVCAFAARGPARYFGGEEVAAEHIIEQIAAQCSVEAQIGIAEGAFAALLADRGGRVVAPGRTPGFLAELPIATLDRPKLADLLWRLGVRTLGQFARLPPSDVLARFGLDAALAQRLAAGLDDRPLAVRRPPPDLEVEERFEEPVQRVDVAAFAARALAERLHERLAGHGLACTRLAIAAVTADGRELHRVWRHDGVLTATAIADRTRWQLEGWLTAGGGQSRVAGRRSGISDSPLPVDRLGCGIIALRLIPEGVLAQVGLQPGLWGEAGRQRERAHRAMHRVQGILGPQGVLTAILGGGRSPDVQATLVPWGDERVPLLPEAAWPGRMPAPAPAVVLPGAGTPVRVVDENQVGVSVGARLDLNTEPAWLVFEPEVPGARPAARDCPPPAVRIVGWAGPWPVDEHWWDERAVRLVRFQALLDDGRAVLLALARGRWTIAADFD